MTAETEKLTRQQLSSRGIDHVSARVVELVVPAPCAWINSNDRSHRMVAARLTAAWRRAGFDAAQGLERFTVPVHVTAWITKARGGRWDPNNLWPTVKAILDGVVSAGLLADDDYVHVVGPDMRYGGKGVAQVRIVVEPIAGFTSES